MIKVKKTKYSWNSFDADCKKIAIWAKGGKFKNIYGIPRGGLIVAVCLSHLLNIPVILHYKEITSKTLIVDDISHSGKTLSKLLNRINLNPNVVTLFWASTSVPPNYWCRKKLTWVIFPWETNTTSRYDNNDL